MPAPTPSSRFRQLHRASRQTYSAQKKAGRIARSAGAVDIPAGARSIRSPSPSTLVPETLCNRRRLLRRRRPKIRIAANAEGKGLPHEAGGEADSRARPRRRPDCRRLLEHRRARLRLRAQSAPINPKDGLSCVRGIETSRSPRAPREIASVKPTTRQSWVRRSRRILRLGAMMR